MILARQLLLRGGAAKRSAVGRILDIILHIGAHRTGTTTLQRLAGALAPALATAGTRLWTPERTRDGLFGDLMLPPGTGRTAAAEQAVERTQGRIAVEVERMARGGGRQLLVTEENMLGSLRANLRHRWLYPGSEERLARFARAFGGAVRRVGIAVRSYDSYWASALAYGVMKGFPPPDPRQLDGLAAQTGGWRDAVGAAAAAFPGAEIRVWTFERLAAQPERALGILTGLHLPPQRAGREVANASPRCDRLRALLAAAGGPAAAAMVPPGDGRWMPFAPDEQAALRARYREDLDWLSAGAGGLARFTDRPEDNRAVAIDRQDRTTGGGLVPRAGDHGGGQNDHRQGRLA